MNCCNQEVHLACASVYTRYEAKRSSDALKDPRIRHAVSTLVYATPLDSAPAHLPVIPGNMEDRLLKEHLARLRGSWRNENYQQSRARPTRLAPA